VSATVSPLSPLSAPQIGVYTVSLIAASFALRGVMGRGKQSNGQTSSPSAHTRSLRGCRQAIVHFAAVVLTGVNAMFFML